MIPRFKNGYTVCQSIAYEFEKMYKVKYQVIRNMPILEYHIPSTKKGNVILYQGAVNKGRGLAQLVEAMQFINAELWVCGNGNFMNDMRDAAIKFGVSNKIIFFGMLPPIELKKKAGKATIAVNPFEKVGLNQYLSLSNKFFDYIHADLPQVAMNYPEYIRINKEYEVALLINDLNPKTISHAINKLLSDNLYYEKLHNNCIPAKENLNWQNEELKLISFYNSIFK
jgi:glycosyltransferase involved in cell wall biosynthesis